MAETVQLDMEELAAIAAVLPMGSLEIAPADGKPTTKQKKKLNPSSPSVVTKANTLIQQTRYSLPKLEQKVLLALIAQIDPRSDISDPQSMEYSISLADFSKLAGVNARDTSYAKYLRATVKSLADHSIWVHDPNYVNSDRIIRWIDEPRIDWDSKRIFVHFTKSMYPYLTQLKSNYTSYNVEFLLSMNSTYSMRMYEILLSYDNGDNLYHYNGGVIFEPVTQEIINKFGEKAQNLMGYKYKAFSIDDLKRQLSPAPPDPDLARKNRNMREKTLDEKYKNFSDFERYVLLKVKEEINERSDLMFDYIPVRMQGSRKYEKLYLFIRYKTPEEMKAVHDFIKHKKGAEPEKPRRKTKKANADSVQISLAEDGSVSSLPVMIPLNAPILEEFLHNPARLAEMLHVHAEYPDLERDCTEAEMTAVEGVFHYTVSLLTSEKHPQKAKDLLKALNDIIEKNNGLYLWARGAALKYAELFGKGKAKSTRYYETAVTNDLTVNAAELVARGRQQERGQKKKNLLSQPWDTVFDEE